MNAARTYYHVTPKKNVPFILKRGLIPNKPKWVSREPRAIFMWGSLESAMMHVADGEVIFEVHIPVSCQIYERRNDGESITKTEGYEYFVCQRITPDNLEIVHEEPEIPLYLELYSDPEQ